MNYKFDLSKWKERIPWDVFTSNWKYNQDIRGVPISGPLDICANEHLRKLFENHYHWGEPEWVDMFVWGKGECENRAATKIGGLPYRPKELGWPVDQGGASLPFIAQFNFTDSKDLVEVPGDILLIFGIIHQGDFQSCEGDYDSLHFEWHNLSDMSLVDSSEVPNHLVWVPEPFHGYIVRVANYPDAKLKNKNEFNYIILNGKKVLNDFGLTTYQGSCIGTSQNSYDVDADSPGKRICTLNSLGTGYFGLEYPWVNDQTPEDLDEEFQKTYEWAKTGSPYPNPKLNIVDSGAIFVRMMDNGHLAAYISYG
jgi:hypothetical protein